jgi:hypothetical protein
VDGEGGARSNIGVVAGSSGDCGSIEGAMRYRPDEIASYAIEGSQIAVFAALGLVLTAIMLGSACHNLQSLPRGPIRWGAAALAVLAFEAPFLWLVRVEPDISLGDFAGAVVLGVISFVLAVCCALVLMDLAGLLARLAGKTDGAERAQDRRPPSGFAMLRPNESKPEDERSEGEKPIFGRELAWALVNLFISLFGAFR